MSYPQILFIILIGEPKVFITFLTWASFLIYTFRRISVSRLITLIEFRFFFFMVLVEVQIFSACSLFLYVSLFFFKFVFFIVSFSLLVFLPYSWWHLFMSFYKMFLMIRPRRYQSFSSYEFQSLLLKSNHMIAQKW